MERAKDLVPVNSYGHDNLGQVLGVLAVEGLASPAQAFAEFEAALAIDRNNVYFYVDASDAALALRDLARAKSYCDRGLACFSGFAPLLCPGGLPGAGGKAIRPGHPLPPLYDERRVVR